MRVKFVSGFTGKSKKPPYNTFSTVTLHDPETLENVQVFLPQDSAIDLTQFKRKDLVDATFEQRPQYGRVDNVLVSLVHVPVAAKL